MRASFGVLTSRGLSFRKLLYVLVCLKLSSPYSDMKKVDVDVQTFTTRTSLSSVLALSASAHGTQFAEQIVVSKETNFSGRNLYFAW